MKLITDILNNLITINKNRIVGYKEAIHDTNESQEKIRGLFKKMVDQSENYIDELKEKIKQLGGEVTDKTITTGLVYNTWMDIIYAGADTKPPIGDFCNQVEETTLQAYEADIAKMDKLDKNIYDMLLRHKKELINAGKQINLLTRGMNKKEPPHTFPYFAINAITLYRLVATLFILYLIFDRQFELFKWLIAFSFFTDAIDGTLARKFKVVSVLGAKMDSIADDLTVLVSMIGLYVFKPDFFAQYYIYFLILLVLFVLQVAAALIRYRRFSSFHTWLAKLAAILQGSFLILMFFLPEPLMPLFYAAIAVTAIDLIEEIIIVFILPEWRTDVKGIYWVMKEK
jgi:uncharacterized protein (TIGR02284 family)